MLGLVRKNQEGLGLLKRLRRKSARKSAKECGSVVPRSGICSSAEKREGIVMLHMCLQVCYIVSTTFWGCVLLLNCVERKLQIELRLSRWQVV